MCIRDRFVGPIEELKQSVLCGNQYTDFRFECRVQYPAQSADDRARFNVSLTFDGQTDPNNLDTHVVTDATALNVSFPSLALKGNVGKSVIFVPSLTLDGRGITCSGRPAVVRPSVNTRVITVLSGRDFNET